MKATVELWKSYSGTWHARIPGMSSSGFKSREEALNWAEWLVRATDYDKTAQANPEVVEIDTEATPQ